MDVDWWRWAHSRKKSASGSCDRTDKDLEFISNGTAGSSLKSLVVKCRKCKAKRDLDDLQRADASSVGYCSGRQPWQAFENRDQHCKGRVSVLLRSQTSVHYADIDSALDLEEGERDRPPEFDQWLQKVHGPTLDAVSGMEQVELIIPGWAKQATSELGRTVTNDEVSEALQRVFASSKAGDVTEEDPMLAEWEKLSRPSPEDNIHAPLRVVASEWNRQAPDSSPIFGLIDSLMLVERLREVRALKGFTRVDPPGIEQGESKEEKKERLLTPDLKRVSDPEQRRWKPAIEVFGEGLFLGFPEHGLQAWEKENAKALERRFAKISSKLQDPENWVSTRFGSLVPVLPRFVLVHTFSHIFMRQLSYESGYNAASIRERLYVFPDKAGILIYTADGDSEGSLGGLVRQGKIDRAPNTINAAIERAAWCSNDPICMEMPENGLEGLNHASCHACSLAPETSCSHLNTLLDRQLVIGDGDGFSEPMGFFTPVLETL